MNWPQGGWGGYAGYVSEASGDDQSLNRMFNATFQCLVRDHLLIDELWSDDRKKFTYFLPKPSSMLCAFFSFEIGWQDEKLGVKAVRPRRGA